MPDYKKLYEELKEEFKQYKRESIKWSVEDFTEYEGYEITLEEAQKALEDMIRHHDANNGIHWDTLEYYLEKYGRRKDDSKTTN